MGDPGIKPLVSDLELNKPRTFIPSGRSLPAGKYLLRVISQRVTPAVRDIFQRPPKERIPVISNTVQFVVHAAPEWQAQQFAEEKKTLNSTNSAPWQKTIDGSFNVEEDFSCAHDLAAKYPDKLEKLKGVFLEEAVKYNVCRSTTARGSALTTCSRWPSGFVGRSH